MGSVEETQKRLEIARSIAKPLEGIVQAVIDKITQETAERLRAYMK